MGRASTKSKLSCSRTTLCCRGAPCGPTSSWRCGCAVSRGHDCPLEGSFTRADYLGKQGIHCESALELFTVDATTSGGRTGLRRPLCVASKFHVGFGWAKVRQLPVMRRPVLPGCFYVGCHGRTQQLREALAHSPCREHVGTGCCRSRMRPRPRGSRCRGRGDVVGGACVADRVHCALHRHQHEYDAAHRLADRVRLAGGRRYFAHLEQQLHSVGHAFRARTRELESQHCTGWFGHRWFPGRAERLLLAAGELRSQQAISVQLAAGPLPGSQGSRGGQLPVARPRRCDELHCVTSLLSISAVTCQHGSSLV